MAQSDLKVHMKEWMSKNSQKEYEKEDFEGELLDLIITIQNHCNKKKKKVSLE